MKTENLSTDYLEGYHEGFHKGFTEATQKHQKLITDVMEKLDELTTRINKTQAFTILQSQLNLPIPQPLFDLYFVTSQIAKIYKQKLNTECQTTKK